MFDVQEITNSLPPARGDEPTSLRQDIIDEILDHLQCGLRRELLINGDDPGSAKRRVLSRFGDPRQIAKKLWYQAMWSKIMSQRLMIGSTILSMAASISLMVTMVLLIQRTDQRQQDQHLVNAALIKQLSNLTVEPKESPSGEAFLQVLVSKAISDGPPAEGFQVVVERQHDVGKPYFTSVPAILMTDKSGSAECGFVVPGRYSLTITTPWGEASESMFIVRPGREHVERIVVPATRPESADISLQANRLPDDLNLEHTVLVVTFSPIGSRDYLGRSWKLGDSKEPWGGIPFLVYIPNRGSSMPGTWIATIPERWWTGNSDWVSRGVKSAKWVPLEPPETCRVPAGVYTVSFILIKVTEIVRPDDPKWRGTIDKNNYSEFGSLATSNNQLEAGQIELKAEIGKQNEWILEIPDDIIEHLIQAEPKRSY